jgi:hypothetical protein
MTLIVFSSKELQARSLYFRISEANRTPERSLEIPRKIPEKDSELERLLRSAVHLNNAQKRAVRIKTLGRKGNSKAR